MSEFPNLYCQHTTYVMGCTCCERRSYGPNFCSNCYKKEVECFQLQLKMKDLEMKIQSQMMFEETMKNTLNIYKVCIERMLAESEKKEKESLAPSS